MAQQMNTRNQQIGQGVNGAAIVFLFFFFFFFFLWEVGEGISYSTAQVKEPILFFISRTNFTIRDFPPSGLE